MRTLNIIARKPKGNDGSEFIVVDRGGSPAQEREQSKDFTHHPGRFVSATANAHSIAHGEWFWGHYFHSREAAMQHFNQRETI